jgi:CspA family cold shock protein
MIGTVKWFNAAKGYGFITPSDGGSDVFVHITCFLDRFREPRESDKVEFDVSTNRGRTCAADVRLRD